MSQHEAAPAHQPAQTESGQPATVKRRRTRRVLRIYLQLNLAIIGLVVWANAMSSSRPDASTQFAVAVVFLIAIVALHVTATFWISLFWPFPDHPKLRFRFHVLLGMAIVLGITYLACLYFVRARPAEFARISFIESIAWAAVTTVMAAIVGLYKSFFERATADDEQDEDIEQARTWAIAFVRRTYDESQALLSASYSEADLESDIREYVRRGARTPEHVHSVARQIVAKIDRYRAFETVRAYYREHADRDGGTFSYDLIESDVDTLLRSRQSQSDLRAAEHQLLARIRELSRWHDERPNEDDQEAESPRSLEDLEAVIEQQVRDEALEDHTEHDIQREISHRLKRLRPSHADLSPSEV